MGQIKTKTEIYENNEAVSRKSVKTNIVGSNLDSVYIVW